MSLQVSKTPPDISLCERQYYFPHTSLYVLSTVSLFRGMSGGAFFYLSSILLLFLHFLFQFLCLHLHLYRIEALTEYALHAALAYEGIRVYRLYDAEDFHAFPFLCHEADHLYRVAGIPSVTVEYCHCVLGLLCYGVGNLLVFL